MINCFTNLSITYPSLRIKNLHLLFGNHTAYRISYTTIPRVCTCTYVTGYWKTDHNVTLGQLHFIDPANSHTHALSMHYPCTVALLG